MKKYLILLVLCLFAYVKGWCYGSIIYSIGWWNGYGPAIIADKGYNNEKRYWEQLFVNNKMGTKTSFFELGDDIFLYESTKYGTCRVDISKILSENGFPVYKSRYKYDLYVLPDDNIFLVADIETSNIVGRVKLPDKIVNIYGYDMVVEGGIAPIRETTGGRYALILDSQNGFKTKSIFSFPDNYDRLLFSTNNRFYILGEKKAQIFCIDYEGNFLWKKKFDSKNETIYGVQETTNFLYLVGSYKNNFDTYGFYTILDCKDGKEHLNLYSTNNKGRYFYGLESFILDFDKEGIKFYFSDTNSNTVIEYTEEDSNIGEIAFVSKIKAEIDKENFDAAKMGGEAQKLYDEGQKYEESGKDASIYYKMADMILTKIASTNNYPFPLIYLHAKTKIQLGENEQAINLLETLISELSKIQPKENKILEMMANIYVVIAEYYNTIDDTEKHNINITKAKEIAKQIISKNPDSQIAKSILE